MPIRSVAILRVVFEKIIGGFRGFSLRTEPLRFPHFCLGHDEPVPVVGIRPPMRPAGIHQFVTRCTGVEGFVARHG